MSGAIDRRRLFVLAGLLGTGAAVLTGQAVRLQVFEHERFVEMAASEHWGRAIIEPRRGTIRDRHGNPLATSVITFRVTSESKRIASNRIGQFANALSPILGVPAEKLAATLSATATKQILADRVPYEAGMKIQSLGLAGIDLERQVVRTHPEGNIAGALIGFVGREHKGLEGVEAYLNRELAGRPTEILYERDTVGNEIPTGYREESPGVEGSDVYLTIDRYVQRVVDAEATAAMSRHKADGVTIIVMDPNTGAILAMATRPTFDLTKPKFDDPKESQLWSNRAVTDMYEPGSIFKILTVAAALEEKKIAPTTTYIDNGSVSRSGKTIVNWDGAANGPTTMTRLLVKSANVGAVWVADRLGEDKFYQYVRAFGFGQLTNIDLGGEAAGQVRTHRDTGWAPIDLATNSFGQGINVTPVQLAAAVSVIANGGKLMQPFVVKEIVGASGRRAFEPVVVRQVISPETARTLREMMVEVVNDGANKAVIEGYRLSGKSGTTQVGTGKGYSDDQTIASFTVFPAENAPFVVLVRVDRPKDVQWGGQVAAPIARTITERLLAYYRIPPESPSLKRPR